MKKTITALALALALAGTLTACSTDKNPGTGGTSGTTGGTASGSGSAGQVTRRYNTDTNQSRSNSYNGQTYLDDGRYSAGSNGQVYRGGSASRDLTRDAQDIVRDTGDAIGDIGRGIGDAARDLTGMGNRTYSGTPSWEPDSSAVRY